MQDHDPYARETSIRRRVAVRGIALLALLGAVAVLGVACDGGGNPGGEAARPGAITGQILWATPAADVATPDGGEPPADAEPERSRAGIRVLLGGTERTARTDSRGNFRFDDVPPGGYELLVELTNDDPPFVFGPYVVRAGQGTDAGEMSVRDIVGERTGASLLGEAGFSVTPNDRNAMIEITVVADGVAKSRLVEPDATFMVEELPLGSVSLYARGPQGWEVVTRNLQLTPGLNTMSEPIILAPLDDSVALLSDEMLDTPMGLASQSVTEAAAGAEGIMGTLILDVPSQLWAEAFAATTVSLDSPTPMLSGVDVGGTFNFPNVGPGSYTITLNSPLLELPEPVLLEVGERQDVVALVYARYLGELPSATDGEIPALAAEAAGPDGGTAILTGRVALGRPDSVIGTIVSLPGTNFAVTPSRDGSFVIRDIPPGTYDFAVRAPDHLPYGPLAIRLPVPGTFDLGTIELALDLDRPRVISASPPDGSRDLTVDYAVPFLITFDQAMDAASVKRAFSISPPVSYRLFMGREAPETSERVLLAELYAVRTAEPLDFNERYRITIGASAANLDGVGMEEPFTLNFSTAKPSIIDTYPEDGSTGALVSVNEAVVIYTNAMIDPTTIDERLVRIRPNRSGSTAIVRATEDAETGWGILEVRYPFEENTNYSVTIAGKFRTSSRSSFANVPYTFSFRTGEVRTRGLDDVASRGRRDRRDPLARQGRFDEDDR